MTRLGTKRILIIAISFFLLVSVCLAYEALSDQESLGKHTLWRVTTDSNTLYILGSLHLLKGSHYPLSIVVEKAFVESQILVFETDLGMLENPSTQFKMMSAGTLPEGSTLKKQLSEKSYELAKEKAAAMGLDIALFQSFEPWFFALTLSSVKLLALGFDPRYGVDQYFYAKAREAKKTVIGLETIEYQLSLFDRLSPADQEAMVYQTLLDLDILEKEMNAITQAWETGDTQALEETLLKSFEEYPAIYKALITRRNQQWIGCSPLGTTF